jgi:hypothetical protein
LYFLYPLYTVYACSIEHPIFFECDVHENIIQAEDICLDDECHFRARKQDRDTDLPISHELFDDEDAFGIIVDGSIQSWTGHEFQVFSVVDKVCSNDLTDVVPVLKEKYTPLYRSLMISPYTTEKVTQLTQENGSLLECEYHRLEKAGEWLIVSGDVRDYCHVSTDKTCSLSFFINPVYFLWYVVSNPSLQTLPYWLMIGGIVVVIILLGKAIRKKFQSG